MNIFEYYLDVVKKALLELQSEGVLPDDVIFENITLEPPREATHGDLSTNAAMVLCKPAKTNPRALAEKIVEKLSVYDQIEALEIAGAGFINFTLKQSVWLNLVQDITAKGSAYGKPSKINPQKINIEFVSANPTGPLHVGHTRGAVFGDALANLLSYIGHDVTREYYINDAGAQVDVLARSSYLRYQEAFGQEIQIPEGLYPGDYLVQVGQDLKTAFGDQFLDAPEDEWLEPVRSFAIEAMMTMIRQDLADIGIEMDVFFSERSLQEAGIVQKTLELLDAKGLIYKGVLPPPKGKLLQDWEEREQTLFRSTDHGDDVDRPMQKSDGSWTYFAPDVAYHKDKLDRGFDVLIDIFGADHGGYVKRMNAAVSALSGGTVPLDIKLCQLVRLFKDGEPYKMSKRAGTFVTLRDILDEVGADVTRFVMLTRKNDMALDFDFTKALEQSKDNPVFYVQYAHARACSVLRNKPEALPAPDFSTLNAAPELALIKKLAEWPRIIQQSAVTHEPHRIAFYLYDVASAFHALWSYGKENIHVRFLQDDNPAATAARMILVEAVTVVLSSNLKLLGVTPLQEM